jgi:hypothetical protein
MGLKDLVHVASACRGTLAALALFARQPAVPDSDLSRQFRAR